MRKGKWSRRVLMLSACLLAAGCAGIPQSGWEREQSAQKDEREAYPEPFEVYAGPSEDYFHCGTASRADIVRVLSVEKDFAEVEYTGGFGYVPLGAAQDLCDGSVAVIASDEEDAPQEGKGALIHFLDQVSVQPLAQTSFYADPDLKKPLFEIGPADAVMVLASLSPEYEQEIFRTEMEKDGDRYRGYVNLTELLDLNNPTTGFSQVSEKNGSVFYQGGIFRSTAGALDQEGWSEVSRDQFVLSAFDWDADEALRLADWAYSYSAATADEKNADLITKPRIQKPFNCVLEQDPVKAAEASLLLKVLRPGLADSSGRTVSVQSALQMVDYWHERMVMTAGEPLEKPYAGQTVSLSELLANQAAGQDPEEMADALIHQMLPGIPASAQCNMELTFSDDFGESPYGWSLFFDQKMDLYAVPVIHPGTSFLIVQDGHPVHDAATDLAGCAIRLSDSIKNDLWSQMVEKGYEDGAKMSVDGVMPSEQEVQQRIAEQRRLLQGYAGEWTIDGPKTMESNQKTMTEFFGSSFRYGSQMTIDERGVFTYSMGVGYGGRGTIRAENGELHYSIDKDLDGSNGIKLVKISSKVGQKLILI